MENKSGFHVTIVENKTGKTLEEFDTKGMLYTHLGEISEENMPELNERQLGAAKIGVGQKMEQVNPLEVLSLMEGLQILMQRIQEENPIVRMLMMITESEKREAD